MDMFFDDEILNEWHQWRYSSSSGIEGDLQRIKGVKPSTDGKIAVPDDWLDTWKFIQKIKEL